MTALIALIAGLLFGSGLLLSGMAEPQRVLGFLDIAGDWNPALALTMGGAVVVAAPAFFYVRRQGRTLLGAAVTLPDRFRIDAALVGGSAIFGIGWGLAGICPGPALLLLTGGSAGSVGFAAGMVAGIYTLAALRRVVATMRRAA